MNGICQRCSAATQDAAICTRCRQLYRAGWFVPGLALVPQKKPATVAVVWLVAGLSLGLALMSWITMPTRGDTDYNGMGIMAGLLGYGFLAVVSQQEAVRFKRPENRLDSEPHAGCKRCGTATADGKTCKRCRRLFWAGWILPGLPLLPQHRPGSLAVVWGVSALSVALIFWALVSWPKTPGDYTDGNEGQIWTGLFTYFFVAIAAQVSARKLPR